MTEQKLAKDLSSVSNEPKADEMEIDLMDILRKIIAIRRHRFGHWYHCGFEYSKEIYG